MTLAAQPTLAHEQLQALDGYWRAANYLSVGQIYLMGNPRLAELLRPEHIKPRLLGHWGTTPGLNFLWAHLNPPPRALFRRRAGTGSRFG
jgi:xylulose-5-phosphate/fructose-6-phosphate phosphoketolase